MDVIVMNGGCDYVTESVRNCFQDFISKVVQTKEVQQTVAHKKSCTWNVKTTEGLDVRPHTHCKNSLGKTININENLQRVQQPVQGQSRLQWL